MMLVNDLVSLGAFLSGVALLSPVAAQTTSANPALVCTRLTPANTYCHAEGSLKKPAVLKAYPNKKNQQGCRNLCMSEPTCASYGFDTAKQLCTTYTKPLGNQRYTPGKTGVFFWRRTCWSCQPKVMTPDPEPDPEPEPACAAQLVLDGAAVDAFNAQNRAFSAKMACSDGSSGPLADLDPTKVIAFDGANVISDIHSDASGVIFPGFGSGFHSIAIYALDAKGNAVTGSFPLVFGSITMPVLVKSADGNPVEGALVEATESTWTGVSQTATTNANGLVSLVNLPGASLSLTATSAGGAIGVQGVYTSTNQVVIQLLAPVTTSEPQSSDLEVRSALFGRRADVMAGSISKRQSSAVVETKNGCECLNTQSFSFDTPPGSSQVFIRYKFQTTEFPEYFGTKFNDYYAVTLRTDNGAVVTISNSMNQLGSGAFDSTSSTDWLSTSLTIPSGAKTASIDVSVANVGDGSYQSKVVIDQMGVNQCDSCSDCSTCPSLTKCLDTCTSPPPQTCGFYRNCVEATTPCSGQASSYAISYGEKQCNAYRSTINSYSAGAQSWIWNTQSCLQSALVPSVSSCSSTCTGIHDAGFNAHKSCYFNNGFCSLPSCTDYVAILATLTQAGLQDPTTKAGSATSEWCGGAINALFASESCIPSVATELRTMLRQVVFKVLQQIPVDPSTVSGP